MTSYIPKVTDNQLNKLLFQLKPIDEAELCSKIQKLMTNIKQYYVNDNCRMKGNNNATNDLVPLGSSATTKSITFVETNSESDSEDVTSSTFPCENDSLQTIKNETPVTPTRDIKSWKNYSSCCNPENYFTNIKNVNLVPQRTLQKIITLENLILNANESIDEINTSNQTVKSKLYNLLEEIKDVKVKVQKGTQNELLESEIIELMKKLKLLFENFYNIKNEFTVKKSSDTESRNVSEESFPKETNNEYPVIPPRQVGKVKLLKEKVNISNITSSSEDLFMLSQESIYRKIKTNSVLDKRRFCNDIKPCESVEQLMKNEASLNQEKLPENVSILKNIINGVKKDILQQAQTQTQSEIDIPKPIQKSKINTTVDSFLSNFPNRNCKSEIYNGSESLREECKEISFKNKPLLTNRLSKSVNSLYQKDISLNKSSKVPILKKEISTESITQKTHKISFISQTITNKVINNLKQLGYLSDDDQKNVKSEPKTCKAKLLKQTKERKGSVTAPITKTTDDLLKSCVESLYLTKLNSYRSKYSCKNNFVPKRFTGSNSKIYCLETLLKKKKYKFVDEKKLYPLKETDTNNQNNGNVNREELQKKNNNKKDYRVDLEMLLSLIGNSIKIVHQLIFFPSKCIERSSKDNLVKSPRLANIENLCSCKITIFTTKDYIKRKIRPIKGLEVIEIHYSLRKGKALGCINMLRNLAGPMDKDMKIYRSSILLPGGYLKEMSSCSINELVHLSMQMNENVKSFQKKDLNGTVNNRNDKFKCRINPQKQKPGIVKTLSLSCIASS